MIILASGSPRRKEILDKLGVRFICDSVDVDESLPKGIAVEKVSEYLAIKKASAALLLHSDDTIIGADTTVVINETVLGKPADEADACNMLKQLSGNKHTVYTGVCILSKKNRKVFTSKTSVYFSKLDTKEIENYIATGEPMDKAGAYGIQGLGCRFIERIDGDFYTVMGLPAARTYEALKNFDI